MRSRSCTLAVGLADYVLGTVAPHDLPALALRALLEGEESSSLAALAGVSPATYDPWEVEELLSDALRELGTLLPSRDDAVQVIIDDTIDRALAGEMSPVGAVSRIVNGAYYASGAAERDSTVAGDSLDLAEIVGLYWAYDEVDQPWSPPAEELDRDALAALERLRARHRPTPVCS